MTPEQALKLWDLVMCHPKAFANALPLFFAGQRWLRNTPNVDNLYNPEHYQAARQVVEFLRSWANCLEIGLREQEAYHKEKDAKYLERAEKPKKARKKAGLDELFPASADEPAEVE